MHRSFSFSDVQEAMDTLSQHLTPTPLDRSISLSTPEQAVFLKLECAQPCVRAFKIRGALNKILSLTAEERACGVTTISSGNHGIAVSYAAKLAGIEDVEIIVPTNTPQSKLDKIAFYGGKSLLLGNDYDGAHTLGEKHIAQNTRTEVESYYADPKIYAGQGTVTMEILAKNPDIDTILVPIGGGGLLGGTAMAAKSINPNIRVIGVTTAACPAMVDSIRDNVCYTERDCVSPSRCEALVGGIGPRAFALAKELVDDFIVVTEEEIMVGLRHCISHEHHIIEASSASVIAAVLFHREQLVGKNVALVLTGGNIADDLLHSILTETEGC